MNYWKTVTLSLLAASSLLPAQTPTPEAPPSAPSSDGLTVREMVDTIDRVDTQFEARQADVLIEVEDPLVMEGTEAAPPEESVEVEIAPSENLPVLPESVPAVEAVADDVYLDFGESEKETVVTRESDTISVDYPDVEVRSIIRDVAELYELNVVIPETLVGSVTLKLRDVTWRQVFDVVLEPLNYAWIEDGNIIKLKSLDELLAEPVSTRVFVVDFATAADISKSVSPMIDTAAGGRIQVDARSNALVITERPSRMGEIQAIISRLDRPTEQVMIESKFVEVTRRDEQNLGINWAALNGYELNAGPVSRTHTNEVATNRSNGHTVQSGSTFDLQDGIQFVETDLVENGLELINNESRIDTTVFSADAFQVILSALQSNNEVELVSNPTVVTMNNTVAQINIGEEFPIPEYRYNEERGSFEVSGFEYKPIGILLNVTPQVNSTGFISLSIKPEISSRTGEVNFGGAGGAAIPIITTRKTESTVTIKSGFTLAIGGLMETRTGVTENKVPVLGDIPGLGRLFKSNTDTLDARNLIIFITAKVLNPDGSTYEDIFDRRTLDEMGISPRDIPGYQAPPSEEALYQRLAAERESLEILRRETELKQQLMLIDRLQEKAEDKEDKRREKEARRNP